MTAGKWRLALWESVKADLRARGNPAMGPNDVIRHGVAWELTDPEIWQNPLMATLTLDERQECKALLADLREQEQAVLADERRETQAGQRPDSIPDFPARYRKAVADLIREQTRLTWENVATEMGAPGGTVRGLAHKYKLGNPSDIAREIMR